MDDLLDMKFDLSIETDNPAILRDQIRESTQIYYHYAHKLKIAEANVAQAKLDLKVLEARLADGMRVDNPKVSETKIDKMMATFPEYVTGVQTLNAAKFVEGKYAALVKSLEQRYSLLVSVAYLIKQELRQQDITI